VLSTLVPASCTHTTQERIKSLIEERKKLLEAGGAEGGSSGGGGRSTGGEFRLAVMACRMTG
jgi:hypothetical protein